MLGDLGSSSDAAAANAAAVEAAFRAQDGCGSDGGVRLNSGEEDKIISNYSRGGGGSGGGEEFGDKSFGGNRWPRQETLALLKIRSDMDVAFRDASVKGPLWDEVSRKLAELGFHRSAKKCKEKFENVYKYHRRTKEGRTGKSEGKTYRFFDQLQALENQPPTPNSATTTHRTNATEVSNTPCPTPPPISHVNSSICTNSTNITVPSPAVPMLTDMPTQGIAPISVFTPTNPTIHPPQPLPPPQATFANPTTPHQTTFVSPPSFPMGTSSNDDIRSNSTSSSTSSDDEMEGRAKRKRKWKDFFERLLKEVVHKQEDLQNRFLEVIEKRERDRMAREEAWRMQEIARINRERDIMNQERSITAAKDAAVMSFLQKMSEQQPHQFQPTQNNINNINNLLTSQAQQQQPLPLPPSAQQSAPPPPAATAPPALQISQAPLTSFEILPRAMNGNGGETNLGSPTTPSSSRWPKVEVHSLIKIRTGMDSKYQENGPKGPLWEEISSAMKNLGYNRSAKRCKEKWENINKYFKKVKESNKKRPEDSKTCPYFHLLDSLYRERNKFDNPITNSNSNNSSKPVENAVPLMVRPEQQWQPPAVLQDRVEPEMESEPMDQNHEEEEEDEDDDDEEDDGNYEIVANKGASVSVSVSVSAAE